MILILLLILLSTALIYLWRKKSFNYWQSKGIPTLPGSNVVFGNFTESMLLRKNFAETFKDAHFALKRAGLKMGGIYLLHYPFLLIVDNDLIKRVLQTDFEYFTDRGVDIDTEKMPLQGHLFNLQGDEWKALRRRLTPTFSSGKIKMMYPLVDKHIDTFVKVIEQKCDGGSADIFLYEYLKKCGIDVIGHVAFGLDCNTVEGENQVFYDMSVRVLQPKVKDILKVFFTELNNPLDIVKLATSSQEVVDFFSTTVRNNINYRKENNIKAQDFLQLLMDIIDENGMSLNMLEIIAQSFLFFIAGFETSATTVNYTMYLLAKYPEVQRKLRQELQKDLDQNDGQCSYEIIMNNEYLDCVVKEALRLIPPVITLNRKCLKDYPVPDTKIVIPKGSYLAISSMGVHHDPDNYENPLEFIPERFNKENSKNLKSCSYLAFGEGPRFCIGKRFGYMQSKLEIFKLVMNFDVKISPNMKPFVFDPITKTLILATEHPILFNFKPLVS